jgi:FMN phosphatase YigB (HAD superfamily)
MKNRFLPLILSLLALINLPLLSKVVVFDLGGVCFETSKAGMAREVNALGLLFNKMAGGDPQARMFEFLNEAFGYQLPTNPDDAPEFWLYAMGHGMALPEIWCENMRGTCSSPELLERAEPHFETFFDSKREQKLIKGLMQAIFDPEIIAKHMYPIKKGAKLVADVAQKEGNTCMVLSNFAADSFDALYAKKESQKIFKHIAEENLIVSGHVGLMKPHADIYEYLKAKLVAMDARFADPAFLTRECIFIDDQIENVIAARKSGITALWLSDSDYKRLREELTILGVL